jgi:hypothetical protein
MLARRSLFSAARTTWPGLPAVAPPFGTIDSTSPSDDRQVDVPVTSRVGPFENWAYDRVLRSPAGRQPEGPVDPDALGDRLRRRLVLNWRGCGGRFAARHGWSGEERRRECRDRARRDDDPRACQLVNADVSTAA